MRRFSTSTVVLWASLGCSSPAAIPIAEPAPAPVAREPAPTPAAANADANANADAIANANEIPPTPRVFVVERPAWTVGQVVALTRTLSVRADQREQMGPPITRSVSLTGLAPLASAVAADITELAKLEAILAAAAGSRTVNAEVPELAAAIGRAFPELTVTVRSATLSMVTAEGASFFIEIDVAGPLSKSSRIVDTNLVGDLFIGPREVKLGFYGSGSVEVKAGLGGRTSPAAFFLALEAR